LGEGAAWPTCSSCHGGRPAGTRRWDGNGGAQQVAHVDPLPPRPRCRLRQLSIGPRRPQPPSCGSSNASMPRSHEKRVKAEADSGAVTRTARRPSTRGSKRPGKVQPKSARSAVPKPFPGHPVPVFADATSSVPRSASQRSVSSVAGRRSRRAVGPAASAPARKTISRSAWVAPPGVTTDRPGAIWFAASGAGACHVIVCDHGGAAWHPQRQAIAPPSSLGNLPWNRGSIGHGRRMRAASNKPPLEAADGPSEATKHP